MGPGLRRDDVAGYDSILTARHTSKLASRDGPELMILMSP